MDTVKGAGSQMDTIGSRIRDERSRLGLSQTAFADLAGQKKNSQINYEADKRSPDGTYLAAIAAAGVDITFVLTGVRTISAPQGSPMQIVLAAQKMLDKAAPNLEQIEHISPQADASEPSIDDFALISRYDAELAAGNGVENNDEPVNETLAFRRDWLQRLGVSASSACLVKVRGESMQPTLHDGDLVLIDRARASVRSGRIYAFIEDGQARVKRLDCIDQQTLLIRSDNPTFPIEIRRGPEADNLRIFGEVVWSGHTFS